MEGNEAYRVFFHRIAIRSIVSADDRVRELRAENKRLRKRLKLVKEIGNQPHDACPVCENLIPLDEEEPLYCIRCNVGLPCLTWGVEEHEFDRPGKRCAECDESCCWECYDEETGCCTSCAKRPE